MEHIPLSSRHGLAHVQIGMADALLPVHSDALWMT